MSRLRCAEYARFSSDRQSPTSIADQIRKCREHAEGQGWLILQEHIYCDEAISGTSTEREGLQRLIAAATEPTHPFDCILIDDSSRLTRKLADALNLYERLTFAGIRVVAVSQGVDSSSPQAELLIGVHGLIDAVYWRKLAQKTHRGMQGLALRGLHTGGRCFGYRSVKADDGSASLEVNQAQADVIRRIFRLYAESGYSLKKIAHLLNAEGVASPQPQKGRLSRSWCVSSVRHILLNRRYSGVTVWNTRRKVRVPGTGKRVFRPRPESEWVKTEAPHLRIVSDELFTAVQRRFQTVKQMFGRDGGGLSVGPKRYLFSGLLKCNKCGGSIALVCGRGRNGADRYGCAVHHQRGNSVCTNSLLVRRDELEESLLRGLSESVLKTEVIDYVVAKLEEALSEEHRNLELELKGLKERKHQIEGELAHLVEAIAVGNGSKTVMDAIAQRERELKSITDRLLEPGPGSLTEHLEKLRAIATEHLTKLRKLVSHPQSVEQTRAVLAEHFGTFKLEPINENGQRHYKVHGKVDFWGDRAVARTGGAGGPACTTRRIEFQVSLAA